MRNLEEIQFRFEYENWWNDLWIPFADNGSGDSLCVDMAGTFGGHRGQIIEFLHEEDIRTIVYASTEKWLETVVEALERDIPYYDDNMKLDPRYTELAAEMNPGYPKVFHATYLGDPENK